MVQRANEPCRMQSKRRSLCLHVRRALTPLAHIDEIDGRLVLNEEIDPFHETCAAGNFERLTECGIFASGQEKSHVSSELENAK